MATIGQIRAAGTTFLLPKRGITEPLNPPTPVRSKLDRFPEDIYDTSTDSHLVRYLTALCGESGAGGLKRTLLFPRLQATLANTHYNDLDRLFGNPLGLPRINFNDVVTGLPLERYDQDPITQALTQEEWQQIRIRDARYRARCLTWMRAILHGPTLEGLALAAEAACGIECDVYEQQAYLDNQASDQVIPMTNYGKTTSRKEVIVVPRAPDITQQERRQILHQIDILKPADTVVTVASGDRLRNEQSVLNVTATSTGWMVKRLVTGRDGVNWPDVDPSEGFWIVKGEAVEAPTFSFFERQEAATYLAVNSLTASSSHIGPFNADQQALFAHLRNVEDPFEDFPATAAAASDFALITFTTPWLQRNAIIGE